MDAGDVYRVYCWAQYELDYVLRDYATAIWTERCRCQREGLAAVLPTVKQLGNILCGKFGQREHRWVHCPECWTEIPFGEWIGGNPAGGQCRYRSYAHQVYRADDAQLSYNAFPALAAWITSYQRVLLSTIIDMAGIDALYWDTDCVWFTEPGERWFRTAYASQIGEELGHWRLHQKCDTAEIFAPRVYRAGDRYVMAGRPKGATRDAGDGTHYWVRDGIGDQVKEGSEPAASERRRVYSPALNRDGTRCDSAGNVIPIELQEW